MASFNPGEPRDERGRWTSSGGAAGRTAGVRLAQRAADVATVGTVKVKERTRVALPPNWKSTDSSAGVALSALDEKGVPGHFYYNPVTRSQLSVTDAALRAGGREAVGRYAARLDQLAADNPPVSGVYDSEGKLVETPRPASMLVVSRRQMNKLMPASGPLSSTAGFSRCGSGAMTVCVDTQDAPLHSGGFHPPAGENVSWFDQVTAHEWGHAIDTRSEEQVAWDEKHMPNAVSQYATTSPRERYAENFAEWYLSKGRTPMLAPRMYADRYGWGPKQWPRSDYWKEDIVSRSNG
jgi:hypothetical protein